MILLKKSSYSIFFKLKKNSPNLNRKNIIPLMLENDLTYFSNFLPLKLGWGQRYNVDEMF